MRILWLSAIDFSQLAEGEGTYHGGWITSLYHEMEKACDMELGITYLTTCQHTPSNKGRAKFFPIKRKHTSTFSKILQYYGIAQRFPSLQSGYEEELTDIIAQFKPTVIHLFGTENALAPFLEHTTIPTIVHLQGLMQPINNAFFPAGMNKYSIMLHFSVREWIMRNGYLYAKRTAETKASKEKDIFKHLQHVMGRTKWDQDISRLFAPETKYYHIDEIMRESFYVHAGEWKRPSNQTFSIISTLSDTIYKGLDTVLKTAKVLMDTGQLSFEWKIVGIGPHSRMARLMERATKTKSEKVNVVYLGVMDEKSLCSELLKSSVYVHTSYIDNSPNSLCEAQMIGLPVIGTYVGGIPSLIEEGKTGLLVPANAPYDLTSAIVKLSQSPDMCDRLSSAGTQCALKRHDANTIIHDMLEIYKSISND